MNSQFGSSTPEGSNDPRYALDSMVTISNLAAMLSHAAEAAPTNGVIFACRDEPERHRRQSYSALLAEARRLQGGLHAVGLRPGDAVCLLLDRAEDFIPLFWACVLGGYVPCPLPVLEFDRGRWASHLEHVNKLLERPTILTVKDLHDKLPDVPGLAVVDADALEGGEAELRIHEPRPSDVALLMPTSGSTGNSKAVALTHHNLLSALAQKARVQDLDSSDVTLNCFLFDHVAALIECHLLSLYVCATQVHIHPTGILSHPLRFLDVIAHYRVTMTFAPNFLFGQINKALVWSPGRSLDLTSLRHIISGGEATVVAVAEKFLDNLAPFGLSRTVIWPAFGMTETSAGCTYSRDFPEVDAGAEFASLGPAMPGLEMRVVDENCVSLPNGSAGELQVRGPMVFHGYLKNIVETERVFTEDGWFRTGDQGVIHDGRLRLVGRSKDSIVVNGVNYFSSDLEAVLTELEGIAKSYVVAFPVRPRDSDTEQLAVGFSPTFPITDEERLCQLVRMIRNCTATHWGFRPSIVLPLATEEFPKTGIGKIQRGLLRKHVESGRFLARQRAIEDIMTRHSGGYSAPSGGTESILAEIYEGILGVRPGSVSATASFLDLGGTSIEILTLKRRIEQRLGVDDLPVATVLRCPTIRALAAELTAAGQPGASGYDPLVPLQLSGERTPLFCIHPGVGEVLVFVNLANYFAFDRPFYALRAPGFNPGDRPFADFSEMVDCYTNAIRRVQPSGPYALAGYSYGGSVAFEIAKRIEAAGDRVAFLGVFDWSPDPLWHSQRLTASDIELYLGTFVSLITQEQADELRETFRANQTPGADRYAELMRVAAAERAAELDLDYAKFTTWVKVAEWLINAGRHYQPSGHVESVTVFHALQPSGTKDSRLAKLRTWDGFTRAANRYIEVPGNHYTLMAPHRVARFQELLRAELASRLEGD